MKILGINAFGQNPSACLVIDGNLVGFSHEERFTRLKCSHGLFPSHTVAWLFKQNQINLADIDRIAFSWGCGKYPWRQFFSLAKEFALLQFGRKYKTRGRVNKKGRSTTIHDAFEHLSLYSPENMVQKIDDGLKASGYYGSIPKIEFIDHHDCHAYQAFYHSPFKEAIVLIADGHGEENCISGYHVKNDDFRKVLKYDIPISLGWFYAGMTAYLGFHANRDEGKLMGLAAYGCERASTNRWFDQLEKVITISGSRLWIEPFFFKFGPRNYNPHFTDHLVDFIMSINPKASPIGIDEMTGQNGNSVNRYLLDEYIDLAYSIQKKLEWAMVFLVNQLVKMTGVRNLCMAGGVAMNCKANGMILAHSLIDSIFVHPASADDGSAIGAAFFLAKAVDQLKQQPLHHAQYGAKYSNDEIERHLINCGIRYKKPNDVCVEAAKMLSRKKILGWFQGASEMGARALGGRSIIANARQSDIKHLINSKIKFRESWRPYCPSILSEYKEKFIPSATDTPFMILGVKASNFLIQSFPAVVHVDRTVRPQTVQKNILPKYHHLINEFRSLTGDPIILNTSFNVRSEPIVNSPADAIRTFFFTDLDALVIEDFIITK